jgi:hypothetical protein
MSSPFLRLILLLLIVGGWVALIGWLIQSFLDLYQTVQDIPVLGVLLVIVLLVILVVFLAAAVYYLFLFRQPAPTPAPPPPRPALPQSAAEKRAAAQQNLLQAEHQAQQIQDEVVRQSLAEKSAAVARNLAQPRLRVVVFGTGSAGKTSLVNALLGKTVGDVGVNLGTTTAAALYHWPLPGIPEPVEILDSPGILEMGQAGSTRETEARRQAQKADLLLVVADGDLRQSEYEPLLHLIKLGKRTLVILNKADLYTKTEQEVLLAHLRERLQGWVAFEDVLLAAANPAPLQVNGGTPVKPTPQIRQVRDRIQAILYAEGPELALDNALLQSQHLGEETQRIIAEQLRRKASEIVDRFQWIVTGVVFANPIPALDLLAIAAMNAQMVVEIGSVYGCKMNLQQGRELAYSLAKTLASLGLIEGAIQLTTGLLTALAEVTVVGFLITAPIQAASAGYLTRIAGQSFIEYFQRNQTWGEEGMQAVVQAKAQQLQQSGWFNRFVQEAMTKVFQPGFRPNSRQSQD